ncbi:hypothetical protein [Candidatus Viridilinea mediisalina]|uniref:Uncharacterized protein n=1 Tax=Candidatus Viridilinea mediisalina TaxID=2024553 RepID=A0A2A6RKS7_9CHLR|nr:hypothetical protein [Candidatus Viridilinea mediisalina]PDW03489.1 hypothetical protein CJ255_08380 [Candidatus Viridilinea mediisalina]
MNAPETQRYTLRCRGGLAANFLADYCPVGTTLTMGQNEFTLANLRTDQAGLLGILRSLHNRGCTLLSLSVDTN